MSETIGPITVSGTCTERTWRITIECPVQNAEADYTVTVHRELELRDGDGELVQTVRDADTALRLAPESGFRNTRTFKALDAVTQTPDVLSDIRSTIEAIIAAQKAAEAAD